MDFQTTLELTLSQIHRRQAEDIDQATIALIDAMDYWKNQQFFFNEGTSLMLLRKGVQDYSKAGPTGLVIGGPVPPIDPDVTGGVIDAVPGDFLRPKSIQVRISSSWSEPLPQVDISAIRHWTYIESNTGYPDFYAWWNQTLSFYPIPQAEYDCRIDYTRDTNRPRKTFDGTSWIFEEEQFFANGSTLPDGSTATEDQFLWVPLESTYTNEWLTHAERLVRARALWDLYHNYYDDTENAMKAQQFIADARSEMDKLSSNFRGKVSIVPTNFGGSTSIHGWQPF